MAKFKPKFKEKMEPRGEERREAKMPPRARQAVEKREMFACGGKVKKR